MKTRKISKHEKRKCSLATSSSPLTCSHPNYAPNYWYAAADSTCTQVAFATLKMNFPVGFSSFPLSRFRWQFLFTPQHTQCSHKSRWKVAKRRFFHEAVERRFIRAYCVVNFRGVIQMWSGGHFVNSCGSLYQISCANRDDNHCRATSPSSTSRFQSYIHDWVEKRLSDGITFALFFTHEQRIGESRA